MVEYLCCCKKTSQKKKQIWIIFCFQLHLDTHHENVSVEPKDVDFFADCNDFTDNNDSKSQPTNGSISLLDYTPKVFYVWFLTIIFVLFC